MRPSVVMLQNHFFVPLLVLWPFFAQCSAQTHQLRSILFPSDGLFGALDALQPPFSSNEEENQHFPQMTIIWYKIRHFHTTKSIWRQNKITNVSKRFVYHMSKLGSWRFEYVKIDQHLLLEPSIDKQRELSCALNTKRKSYENYVYFRMNCEIDDLIFFL